MLIRLWLVRHRIACSGIHLSVLDIYHKSVKALAHPCKVNFIDRRQSNLSVNANRVLVVFLLHVHCLLFGSLQQGCIKIIVFVVCLTENEM